MAYINHLEMSLTAANERIQTLELELCSVRAESLVSGGCMLIQQLIDPDDIGGECDMI
jgi:hypothetical protein